jgi:MFS family permease
MPWPTALRAFRHRDFRLFWAGQLVSLVGSWMQSVGQSWVVLELTHSPFKLGMINALQFGPMLFLSFLAGALADRVRKRRLLLLTQSALMLQAFALAALDRTGQIQYWHVAVLATLYGIANTLDLPARQSSWWRSWASTTSSMPSRSTRPCSTARGWWDRPWPACSWRATGWGSRSCSTG